MAYRVLNLSSEWHHRLSAHSSRDSRRRREGKARGGWLLVVQGRWIKAQETQEERTGTAPTHFNQGGPWLRGHWRGTHTWRSCWTRTRTRTRAWGWRRRTTACWGGPRWRRATTATPCWHPTPTSWQVQLKTHETLKGQFTQIKTILSRSLPVIHADLLIA